MLVQSDPHPFTIRLATHSRLALTEAGFGMSKGLETHHQSLRGVAKKAGNGPALALDAWLMPGG